MRPTDSVADLLTRIRNAQKAGQEVVSIPASKLKIALTHILREEGLIRNYKCIRDRKQGVLKVALRYQDNGQGAISELNRVSTPGRRVYVSAKDIPMVRNGFGIAVLSTSQGVMTDREARKLKLGGEYIFSAY
jgi:small subunit ribosomal protein S8